VCKNKDKKNRQTIAASFNYQSQLKLCSNPFSMSNYTEVKDPEKAGSYPATAHEGGGYV
jgi:hypothetical protein